MSVSELNLAEMEQEIIDVGCEVTLAHAMIHLEQAIEERSDETQVAHNTDIAARILVILSQRYYRKERTNEHQTSS